MGLATIFSAANAGERHTNDQGIPRRENQLWRESPTRHRGVVLIRREAAGDSAAVHAVTAAAFAEAGAVGPPAEPTLVDELRADGAWLAALSLVAVDGASEVIGHVLCTRGYVDQAPVLALGPLSVRPDCQRRGVGSALMHAVLGAGDALDEPLVGLLGSPAYYRRFGFRLSDEYGIAPPVPRWQPHFQVRVLTAYRPDVRGTFAYPEPFDRV
jgi:putative acetyltransferase